MPAIVEVLTTDGRTFRERVDYDKGRAENQLSKAKLEEKFVWRATPAVGKQCALDIMALVGHLDSVASMRNFIALMR